MHRLCDVANDNHLPEALRLLAKSTSKSRDYAILGNLFRERAQASPVPLTASQAPLATTKLVDGVFRNFTPAGTGLTFACYLTPFAIVCEGHAEAFANRRLMKKAEISEGGTSMSLQDAESISSADVKFPSTACFAGEKLHGWSVVIDVFHGVAHDVATRVRNFVIAVVPHLHSVQHKSLPRRQALAWTWSAVHCAKLSKNTSVGRTKLPMEWLPQPL